eukprot:9090704-Pyramimonas_sp.AAC.1
MHGSLAEHIFGDITDFLPAVWKSRCGLHSAADKWSPAQLRAELPCAKLLLRAKCFKCNGSYCALSRTHIHRAGSPCVLHSRFGNQLREFGNSHFLFYAWVALTRQLLHTVVLHENVPEFGDEELTT